MNETLKIYTDGASRGNPGPSAFSIIFVRDGEILYQTSEFLGTTTNNVAEYNAVIKALENAQKYTNGEIELYSDSELVVKQINKEYKIKKEHLLELCSKVYELCKNFKEVKFMNVPRENTFIQKADKLCNECLNLSTYISPS